jgi:hypothetical protein
MIRISIRVVVASQLTNAATQIRGEVIRNAGLCLTPCGVFVVTIACVEMRAFETAAQMLDDCTSVLLHKAVQAATVR